MLSFILDSRLARGLVSLFLTPVLGVAAGKAEQAKGDAKKATS